jgi:hypothetical protein
MRNARIPTRPHVQGRTDAPLNARGPMQSSESTAALTESSRSANRPFERSELTPLQAEADSRP